MNIEIANKTGYSHISKKVKSMIDDLQWIYKDNNEINLVDVRLIGSVARGDECEGYSDFSIVSIVRDTVFDSTKSRIMSKAALLQRKYKSFNNISISLLHPKQITPLLLLYLKSDSFSLWGENLFKDNRIYIEKETLHNLATPQFDQIISEGRKKIGSSTESNLTSRYIRKYSSELFRFIRGFLIKEINEFPIPIKDIYTSIKKLAPSQTELIESIYSIYMNPDVNKGNIYTIFDELSFVNELFI